MDKFNKTQILLLCLSLGSWYFDWTEQQQQQMSKVLTVSSACTHAICVISHTCGSQSDELRRMRTASMGAARVIVGCVHRMEVQLHNQCPITTHLHVTASVDGGQGLCDMLRQALSLAECCYTTRSNQPTIQYPSVSNELRGWIAQHNSI